MMEKAVLLTSLAGLESAPAAQRIYFGCEFCQLRLPSPRALREICALLKKQGKPLTLVTPFVTASGLRRVAELLDLLQRSYPGSEAVFNDWGVFRLLQGYPGLHPVLGRLLTRQRRDPRALDYLLNRTKPSRVRERLADGSLRTVIFKGRRVPESLYRSFRQSLINLPVFGEFLLHHRVNRVEIDNLLWDMDVRAAAGIGVSIYHPYGYITTTRLCGLVNMTYRHCGKECQKQYVAFKASLCRSAKVPFFLRGNTVFYRSRLRPVRQLEKMGIDRIVIQPQLPL